MDFCVCEKDVDGHCLPCKRNVHNTFSEMVKLFREFQERMDKLVHSPDHPKPCVECAKKYSDWAIANLVTELAGQMPTQDVARSITGFLAGSLASLGVTKIPLTEKAWVDLCAKNGWSPV